MIGFIECGMKTPLKIVQDTTKGRVKGTESRGGEAGNEKVIQFSWNTVLSIWLWRMSER